MNLTVTPEIQAIVTKLYQAAHAELQDKIITLLHITEEYTILASGKSPVEPDDIHILPLGSRKTSEEFFKHIPPTLSEIEYAINFTEDNIIPIKKLLPANSELCSASPVIHEIALQSGKEASSQKLVLSIKEMEDIFSRLAAIISGRPFSTDTLPESNSFAVSLLILREVMHHLGFQNITIMKPQQISE
jgi:exopolyphosphatase/pppGpp-phosphohydrolase